MRFTGSLSTTTRHISASRGCGSGRERGFFLVLVSATTKGGARPPVGLTERGAGNAGIIRMGWKPGRGPGSIEGCSAGSFRSRFASCFLHGLGNRALRFGDRHLADFLRGAPL